MRNSGNHETYACVLETTEGQNPNELSPIFNVFLISMFVLVLVWLSEKLISKFMLTCTCTEKLLKPKEDISDCFPLELSYE